MRFKYSSPKAKSKKLKKYNIAKSKAKEKSNQTIPSMSNINHPHLFYYKDNSNLSVN